MRTLAPLLVCLLAVVLLDAEPLAAQLTVFQAAMPPMVTAAIMAMAAGFAPRLCTATIGIGLGLSLLTLPLWFAVVRWLLA